MDIEDLRLALYRTFAHEVRPPTPTELSTESGYVMDLATLWRFSSHWYTE
jgi:hypothetical protein